MQQSGGGTAAAAAAAAAADGDEADCSSSGGAGSSGGGSSGGGGSFSEDEAGSSEAGSSELQLGPCASLDPPDHTFKVLLLGDSGVGKTCLVLRYISDAFSEDLPSTVGVDFAIKRLVLHGASLKVAIWDTAGQERFRALTSTFYRNAHGVMFVFDVTRRDTLASLADSWMAEAGRYSPHPHVARMVVANKIDQGDARQVSWQEGASFAAAHGCLYVESSAKQNVAVGVAFEELLLAILQTPSLLAARDDDDAAGGRALSLTPPPGGNGGGRAIACSC